MTKTSCFQMCLGLLLVDFGLAQIQFPSKVREAKNKALVWVVKQLGKRRHDTQNNDVMHNDIQHKIKRRSFPVWTGPKIKCNTQHNGRVLSY